MKSFFIDENQVEQIEGMTTEYPYCLHQRDLTDFIIPWHWHEELELGYIQEGTSQITTVGADKSMFPLSSKDKCSFSLFTIVL